MTGKESSLAHSPETMPAAIGTEVLCATVIGMVFCIIFWMRAAAGDFDTSKDRVQQDSNPEKIHPKALNPATPPEEWEEFTMGERVTGWFFSTIFILVGSFCVFAYFFFWDILKYLFFG